MNGFSLRTMMLVVMSAAILCALFTTGGWNANTAHLLLVLAFAIPGGSLAFDRRPTHRSAIIGTCISAVIGTCVMSILILVADFWQLMA